MADEQDIDDMTGETSETKTEIKQGKVFSPVPELDKLAFDMSKRIKYVDLLFGSFKKMSNLWTSIQVGPLHQPLGEFLKNIDAQFDNCNYEYAAEQYKCVIDRILDMISNDYVGKMRNLLGMAFQILNEFESLNKYSEQELTNVREQINILKAELDTLKVKPISEEGKVLDKPAIESVEDDMDVSSAPEIPALDMEQVETFKEAARKKYSEAKNHEKGMDFLEKGIIMADDEKNLEKKRAIEEVIEEVKKEHPEDSA